MKKVPLYALVALSALTTTVWAADTSVDQVGQKFSESSVSLKIGETLSFVNHDDVTHNIMVVNSDGDADDKGLQKPGEIIKQKFDAAGEYTARCNIHPRMKMTVVVK